MDVVVKEGNGVQSLFNDFSELTEPQSSDCFMEVQSFQLKS